MVRIELLGTVEVRTEDGLVDLGHARQRTVLVALVMDANRVVSTDRLVDRVWGDDPPDRARGTLYSYLARLRAALAGTDISITRGPGGYVLNVDESAVDLYRFRQLISHAGSTDDATAASVFDQAMGLWRGEALAGLDTPWINEVRAALDKEKRAAALDQADVLLRRGQHTDLLASLSDRVARFPLDERLAGQLILALYRSGRQADALEQYHRTRRLLADELGADPSRPLQDLHQQILTADPRLTPSAPAVRAAVPRQLPAAPRLFTGRDRELAALTEAVETGTTVMISALAGAGGIGKTWLALHWAHQNLARFPDGQLFVDLGGFSPEGRPLPPATVLRGFLDALGVEPGHIPAEVQAQSALLRSTVMDKRMLIVLDNALDTAQVAPLLPGSPACTVLVTSRNHLPGLLTRHGAQHLTVDVISDDEAHAMLAARLGADRLAAQPAAVATLLACCNGFPLALSIVAGRAQVRPDLPLAVLAAELTDAGLGALDEDDPGASLPAVLSWSYEALNKDQARLFGLLGLMPGPDISLAAATALADLPTGQASVVLRGLVQASLLDRDSRGRYRMHDLIRRYAASGELAEPERTSALRRVVDFYLHTALAGHFLLYPHRTPIPHDPPVDGCRPLDLPDLEAATGWFEAEHTCLLAAQQAAFEQGWYLPAVQLAWSLITFHRRRGFTHDYVAVWQTALSAANRLDDANAQIVSHRQLGHACARASLHAEALDHLQQALTLASRIGDTENQAHAHQNLAVAWSRQGDDRQALSHVKQALELFRTLGNPAWVAGALNNVGWYSARVGEYAQAREYCEAALELVRRQNDREAEAITLDSLGYIAHHAGELSSAVSYYSQALTRLRALGHTYEVANTLDHLGHLHTSLDQPSEARTAWEEALELYTAQHRGADADRVRQSLTR